MPDEPTIKINIATSADVAALSSMEAGLKKVEERAKVTAAEYEAAFAKMKENLANVMGGEGASPEFITAMSKGMDDLKAKLEGLGGSENLEQVNAEIGKLVAGLQAAAEAEGVRIQRSQQAAAVAEQNIRTEQQEASQQRAMAQQRVLDSELEELDHRKRMAHTAQQVEMERALAQAAQMRKEQQVHSAVMNKGDYHPAEDVAAWKARETTVKAVGVAAQRSGANAGLAALQLAQFVDDAQYGIKGILNNIPGLILAIGGSAGLAGVISIAAVALTKLWEHFGGAKKAEEDTKKAKDQMEALKTAIGEAVEEQSKLADADLEAYIESVKAAAGAWEQTKNNITEAAEHTSQLAAAELAAAQARLEIERQGKLLNAKDDDERASINTQYDASASVMNAKGGEERRQREAENMQRLIVAQQTRAAEFAETAARMKSESAAAAARSAEIGGGIGKQSDQGRRVTEMQDLDHERGGLMFGMKKNHTEAQALVDNPNAGFGDVAAADTLYKKIEAAEARMKEIENRRAALTITQGSDQKALKTGEGLDFKTAKEEAEKDKNTSGMAAYAAAEGEAADLAKKRAEIAQQLIDADKKILADKFEAADMQRKKTLLEKKQEAARLEDEAKVSKEKAQTAKQEQEALKKKAKAAEDAAKKARDEKALEAENDAADFEKKGDPKKAAAARNRAAEFKLGPDASAQEKRRVKLDNNERTEKAKGQAQGADAAQKGDQAAGALRASGLGEAADKITKATDSLRDGASSDEAAKAAQALAGLAPLIGKMNDSTKKALSDLWQAVKLVESQIKNSR